MNGRAERIANFDRGRKQRFRRRLLSWFHKNARDLPWRRTRDPYHVWVSEIMLQQTQVVTVIPYFERFIKKFPDVQSLAAAREEDVLRLWEGLGYYRRARQLHHAAAVIVAEHNGQFPVAIDHVRALPGIGRYTAGAILSIAHDARQPILEANTVRVFSRLMAFGGDPSRGDGQSLLWRFAEDLLPNKNCGAFNQALMELGSEICRPRDPLCEACPVAVLCPTFAAGLQTSIPAPKRKIPFEEVREAAVVVRRRGEVLLRRCGAAERWTGLWDFPRFPVNAQRGARLIRELRDGVELQTGLVIRPGCRLTTIKHGVTRFRITLSCYAAELAAGRLHKRFGEMQWVRPAGLEHVPLSVTGRKISKLLYEPDG